MTVEKLITDHIDIWSSALQTRSTAGRSSNGKIDLYGIKKLRELILELAVRGKLVPQDPNDEPASELLKRIVAEKAELVKQGIIKKQKLFPEISEDEKPFELPSGWEWVRIEAIGHDWGQKTPINEFTYLDVGSISKELGIVCDPTILQAKDAPSRARKIVKKGTVIYSTIRPYLLNIAVIESDISPEPIASTAFSIIHPLNGVESDFICQYLRSPVFISYVESCQTGIAYPAINDKQFFSGIIAIPPSEEQKCIVAKTKELMSLCGELEQQSLTSLDAHQQLVETLLATLTDSQNAKELAEKWARISQHFDTLFTTEASIDALKQTILQLAVMGKLVPQDPNDEPASELLKRIEQEKTQLVKVGKIKKQKPLPPVSDEEKPFELPLGWEWCRFEDIVDIQSGITKGRNLVGRTLTSVPYLRVANVQRGYLDLSDIKTIDIPVDEKEKYHVKLNDLLITEGGDWDTVGRTAIWTDSSFYVANQNHVFKARPIVNDLNVKWIEKFMNSSVSRNYFAGASKQTTNLASINKTQLRGCFIALPPINETRRILDQYLSLLNVCDGLKSRLQSAQQTQLHLADALTGAALN